MREAAARLAMLEPRCTTEQALAFFDALPSVSAEDISGRWAGRELETGHPWDGLLTASGWYGKQFDSPEAVHPLLFQTPKGTLFFSARQACVGIGASVQALRPLRGRATPEPGPRHRRDAPQRRRGRSKTSGHTGPSRA